MMKPNCLLPVLALSLLGAVAGCAVSTESYDLDDESVLDDEDVGEAQGALNGNCTWGDSGCVMYSISSGFNGASGSCPRTVEVRAVGSNTWYAISGNVFYSANGVGGVRTTITGTGNGCKVDMVAGHVTKFSPAPQVHLYSLINPSYPAAAGFDWINTSRSVTLSTTAPTPTPTGSSGTLTTSGLTSCLSCGWINANSYRASVEAGTTAIVTVGNLAFNP